MNEEILTKANNIIEMICKLCDDESTKLLKEYDNKNISDGLDVLVLTSRIMSIHLYAKTIKSKLKGD